MTPKDLSSAPHDRLILGIFEDGSSWPVKWIGHSETLPTSQFDPGFRTFPANRMKLKSLIAWVELPTFDAQKVVWRLDQAKAAEAAR